MNWFNRVRNSLTFLPKKETDKDLWVKCPGCQQMVFAQEYEDNLYVCPRCDHHGRIGADERLRQILDPGYGVLSQPDVREDPLKFRDTKKYTDRLKQARAKNPHKDAFTVGSGEIDGTPAVVGVQDFGFMGGSMGMAVGTAFCKGAERAIERNCAYVVVTAAGGARMQEGILVRVLRAGLLQPIGVFLGVAEFQRILAHLGLRKDAVTRIEQLAQPLVRADAAMMVAARADIEIVLVFLRKNHLLASGAFDPQILVGLPLGQEGQRISDAIEPVHGAGLSGKVRGWRDRDG